jgi:hypothetical protein
MHWPLPLHLGRDIPRDVGDPLVQAWEVAWGGHALRHQPLDYFQANTFWPLRNSLAFSEALAGYAPAGLLGSGTHAAVVRYNILFLFSYALAFFGAYLLARELGAGRAGAAVAGAAFAYAPWRLEQDGHLHVLSSGGIPLSLFLLVRGYRLRRPGLILGGWAVATWQFTLGFTLGLQLAYLIAVLALIAVVAVRGRHLRLGRWVVAATTGGALLFAVVAVLLARPYMQVIDDHPEAKRTAAEVAGLSGPVQAFAAAPVQNLVWGEATARFRRTLTSVPEQTLFPGLAIVALSIVGLAAPVYPRRLRFGLAFAVLAFAVLSLGFRESGIRFLSPYRLLYELAPGWSGIRVPGRLMTMTTLALALLAAAGAQHLVRRVERDGGARRAGALIACVLVAAVLVEGSGFGIGRWGETLAAPAHPRVPQPPAGQRGVSTPQLHLPLNAPANRRYVLWSSDGFPRMVNGRGSFIPRSFEQLAHEVSGFPDERSVASLRSIGVRSVLVHAKLAPGTPWADALERRPSSGLAVTRTARNGVVVFQISPR